MTLQEKITNYLNIWGSLNRFEGTILVFDKDNEPFIKSYGYADVKLKIRNDENTIYHIASVSKLYIATGILQLIERRLLHFLDTMDEYIPGYPHGDKITIHHLLSHSSGIIDHTGLPEYNPAEVLTTNQILERISKHELHFTPGETFEYSNSNYVILSKIIEIVSKENIEEYLFTHIFEPLGLFHTGISKRTNHEPHFAKGYTYSGEGRIIAPKYHFSGAFGSGFIHTSIKDLHLYIKGLLTGKLISRQSFQRMFACNQYVWYLSMFAGYGCFVDQESSCFTSNGMIHGFTSNLYVNMKDEQGILILSNNDTIPVGRLTQVIKTLMSDQEAPQEDFMKPIIDVPSSLLDELKGTYVCQYTNASFTISKENEKLVVDQLWAQTYQDKKYELVCTDYQKDSITFLVSVCEGKFVFYLNEDSKVMNATYTYDTFTLPYEKR